MTYDIDAVVRRRTRRVIVAAVIAVLVMLGVTITALTWHRGDPAAAPQPARTAATGGPSATDTASTAPTPSASAGQVDLTDISWIDVRGMALPVSTRSGPASQHDGRTSGFARTQTGALLAAAHITIHADAVVGPAVFRPTIAQQITGTDADALLSSVETDYETRRAKAGVAPGAPLPVTYASLAGYRFDSYTDTSTFLRVLLSTPGPQAQGTVYIDFRLEVRWVGNDWRLVAPVGGSWRTATAQVSSPDGYTPFPPRR